MIYAIADNSYLLLLDGQPTRSEFLRSARVRPGTYAEAMISGLYDQIFLYSRELSRDYRKYYVIEYPRFSDFVEALDFLPEAFVPKMNSFFKKFQLIIPLRAVPGYLTGDEGLALLRELFPRVNR